MKTNGAKPVRRAMRIVGLNVQVGAGIVLTPADAVGE